MKHFVLYILILLIVSQLLSLTALVYPVSAASAMDTPPTTCEQPVVAESHGISLADAPLPVQVVVGLLVSLFVVIAAAPLFVDMDVIRGL